MIGSFIISARDVKLTTQIHLLPS